MSDKIIQIQNVNKWFGDFQVLKDINLKVEQKQKIEAIQEKTKLKALKITTK